MALFSGYRAKRRDDADLGTGIWRRAHGRYIRGLDRLHQVLESADGELYDQLVLLANELSGALPRVRAVCMEAQSLSPSDGLDVPGGPMTGLHRCLSKAGNALATTAEAAAMASLGGGASLSGGTASSGGVGTAASGGAGASGVPSPGLETVRRRADAVLQDLSEAESILERARAGA